MQRIHIVFGIEFGIVGLAYAIHLVRSGRWRLPKYEGPQRLAYTGVMLLAVGQALTGIALYFRGKVAPLVFVLGGRAAVRYEHLGITAALPAFVLVHVVQVIRSGRATFTEMAKS